MPFANRTGQVFELDETVGTEPRTFILPNRGADLAVTVDPSVGVPASATVQVTYCTEASVAAGEALWLPWAFGTITAPAGITEMCSLITAVRVSAADRARVVIAQASEC
jgi:hypothetical protein